jgi:hypothetical protein
MGAPEETLALLLDGLTPGQISSERGVTLSTTLGYLNKLVGEGKLRRSDILYSIPSDARQRIITAMGVAQANAPSYIAQALRAEEGDHENEISRNDIEVVWRYHDAGISLGDMYEDLRELEVWLHQFLRRTLEGQFGSGEEGWWRRGVPVAVRKSCQVRREEDEEPVSDPYSYTTICDLKKIVERNWTLVAAELPGEAASNRKRLLRQLDQLNQIRRSVMHPVRGEAPTEADFEFVRDLKLLLGLGQH